MSASGLQQHTWCLRWSLPFTPSRQWLGSAIGCYSVMVGHKSLSQISQQRQTLSTDGVPVVRMATWEREKSKDTVSTFCFCCKLQIQSEHPKCVRICSSLSEAMISAWITQQTWLTQTEDLAAAWWGALRQQSQVLQSEELKGQVKRYFS